MGVTTRAGGLVGGVTCWAAVGIAAVLGLAGCTSSGSVADPPASTGTTTSPSSTASATTSGGAATSSRRGADVDVPKAAQKHTKKGAEAFAKFYLKAISAGYANSDSLAARKLSTKACEGCIAVAQDIEAQEKSGRHPERARLRIATTNIRPGATKDAVQVDVLGREVAVAVLDRTGAPVGKAPARDVGLTTKIRWTSGGWRTSDLRGLS